LGADLWHANIFILISTKLLHLWCIILNGPGFGK
jgi:hypothetical protein